MVKDRPKPVEKTVEKYFALVFQIQQALEPSSGLMSSSVPLLPSIKSLQLKHQRAHKALKKEKVLGCLAFPIHCFNLCMIYSKIFFLIKVELLCNPLSGPFRDKIKLQDPKNHKEWQWSWVTDFIGFNWKTIYWKKNSNIAKQYCRSKGVPEERGNGCRESGKEQGMFKPKEEKWNRFALYISI